MNGGVVIREIAQMDLPILEALSSLLIDVVDGGASVGFLPPIAKGEAVAYWRDALQPGVILWVAERDRQLLGTVQLQLAMKANGRHRAEVAKLMTAPGARRQGIARRLMHAAEARAKLEQRSLLVLDTRSGDPSNILYRSLGYVEAGRIPEYAISADGTRDETTFYYKRLAD